jgi:hypothetical protein
MTTTTGASETWQARIGHDMAAQLRRDAELLGLDGRTEVVEAALELLHRRAAEERMARGVDEFYGNASLPSRSASARPPGRPMPRPKAFRGEVWDVDFPTPAPTRRSC